MRALNTNHKITASICTKGRYFTTLPMAISAVINQTKKIDKLILYDDNDPDKKLDLRDNSVYARLFQIIDAKGIEWQVIFGSNKGQHHGHQIVQSTANTEWIWRVDDDTIPEPNVLEELCWHIQDDVAAVGGAVLTPPMEFANIPSTGKIENIYNEPNIQWSTIKSISDVDHLHCTFIYRRGIHDYNVGLSRVAHREETLFTYGLKQRGYRVLAVPNATTWHLKNPNGGIRSNDDAELYHGDEDIFRTIIDLKDQKIVVLNNGMGDHIVFKHVLPDIVDPIIFSCYPEIIPGRSIQEAKDLLGDIEPYNIYRKMDEWHWTQSLENAFRKLYIK